MFYYTFLTNYGCSLEKNTEGMEVFKESPIRRKERGHGVFNKDKNSYVIKSCLFKHTQMCMHTHTYTFATFIDVQLYTIIAHEVYNLHFSICIHLWNITTNKIVTVAISPNSFLWSLGNPIKKEYILYEFLYITLQKMQTNLP